MTGDAPTRSGATGPAAATRPVPVALLAAGDEDLRGAVRRALERIGSQVRPVGPGQTLADAEVLVSVTAAGAPAWPAGGAGRLLVVRRGPADNAGVAEPEAADEILLWPSDGAELAMRLGAAARTAALRRERRRLQAVIEAVYDGVAMADRDGRITFASERLCEMTGFAPGELVGAGIPHPFWPADRVDELMETFTRCAETGSGEWPAVFARADGSEFPVLLSIARVAGTDEHVATMKDMSGWHEAERALRESEAGLRLLTQNVTDVIARVSQGGRVLYVSPACREIIGVDPEDIVGTPAIELVHPDDRARVAEIMRSHASGRCERSTTEMRVVRRDGDDSGAELWVEVRARTVEQDDGTREIDVALHDVSARKAAEQALSAGQARLGYALQAGRDGVWDWNVPTGEIYFSDRWFEMLGYAPGELPMRLSTWRGLVHPDDLPGAEHDLREHLAGRSESYEYELRMRTAHDGWCWVLTRGRVVERDAGGAPVRAVGTHIDITERRTADEVLRRERDRWRALVAAMHDGVLNISADGVVTEANDSFCAQVGLTPALVVGLTQPYPWWPPELVEACMGFHARARRGETLEAETVLVRADGGRFPALISSAPLSPEDGGAEAGVVITIKDIGDRVRVEEEQAALHRVAAGVAAGADPGETLSVVAREAATLFGADAGVVVEFADGMAHIRGGHEGPALEPGATHAAPAPRGPVPPHPLTGQEAYAEVWRRRTSARVRYDAAARRRGRHPFREAVGIPVVVEGRLWGSIALGYLRGSGIPDDLERRLSAFGELVALAVDNAQKRARLIAQATTDPLTGLANHRAFHEALRACMQSARAGGTPLALVVLDLDHFKQVNDSHGHVCGDEVLRNVGRRLREATAVGEVAARVGGEEFAWLLPGLAPQQALPRVERLRAAVAGDDGPAGHLTISAGLAGADGAADAETLYVNADIALYWSKASGRDRASVHSYEVAERLLRHQFEQRTTAQSSLRAMRALAWAVDAKDPMTHRHSERVADLCVAVATALGWPAERAAQLREAALVHDVGKIGIPDSVLFKSGRLSDAEYEEMKNHAAIGAQIVSDVLSPEQASWVRHHHERWDGRGYPEGLAGERVPEGSRLIALADSWDAITSARSYKEAASPQEALAEIRRCSGGQFWPAAVTALERVVAAGALPASVAGGGEASGLSAPGGTDPRRTGRPAA